MFMGIVFVRGRLSSILDVVTIFGNQIWLFLWDSSRITMELNHGIQGGYACIPDGIHMEWIIPSSFHIESMMSMELEIGWGLSQHPFYGFHME